MGYTYAEWSKAKRKIDFIPIIVFVRIDITQNTDIVANTCITNLTGKTSIDIDFHTSFITEIDI